MRSGGRGGRSAPLASATRLRIFARTPGTAPQRAILAIESLVFIGVHVRYRETGSIIMSAVLGLLMAFIAYGRLVLKPIV